jgi:DNA-binding XRE family transcriptional regulator
MSEQIESLADAIKTLRKHCSLTQVEFAVALSVAPASIHRWEAGTSSPEFEMIVSLWSFAVQSGSPTSRYFADFLVSRTDAIKPLFNAAQLPELKAIEKEISELDVAERQLVLALVNLLKRKSDETAIRGIRALLQPWTVGQDPASHSKRETSASAPNSKSHASRPKKR